MVIEKYNQFLSMKYEGNISLVWRKWFSLPSLNETNFIAEVHCFSYCIFVIYDFCQKIFSANKSLGYIVRKLFVCFGKCFCKKYQNKFNMKMHGCTLAGCRLHTNQVHICSFSILNFTTTLCQTELKTGSYLRENIESVHARALWYNAI